MFKGPAQRSNSINSNCSHRCHPASVAGLALGVPCLCCQSRTSTPPAGITLSLSVVPLYIPQGTNLGCFCFMCTPQWQQHGNGSDDTEVQADYMAEGSSGSWFPAISCFSLTSHETSDFTPVSPPCSPLRWQLPRMAHCLSELSDSRLG